MPTRPATDVAGLPLPELQPGEDVWAMLALPSPQALPLLCGRPQDRARCETVSDRFHDLRASALRTTPPTLVGRSTVSQRTPTKGLAADYKFCPAIRDTALQEAQIWHSICRWTRFSTWSLHDTDGRTHAHGLVARDWHLL